MINLEEACGELNSSSDKQFDILKSLPSFTVIFY